MCITYIPPEHIVMFCLQDISARYGVLKEDAGVALRGLFIINPEGTIEQVTINNMGIGRNVDEAKRLLQAIQFVAEHGEVRRDRALCTSRIISCPPASQSLPSVTSQRLEHTPARVSPFGP